MKTYKVWVLRHPKGRLIGSGDNVPAVFTCRKDARHAIEFGVGNYHSDFMKASTPEAAVLSVKNPRRKAK